ncbi:MAG: S46 family peptidase [Rhodothermales bacterium]
MAEVEPTERGDVITIASTETPSTPTPRPLQLTPFPAGYDSVQVPTYGFGKMWTFDDPPEAYIEATYDIDVNAMWFEKARKAALKFSDNCSASFVSPNGLVMTNHHCAREHITEVTKDGESLMDNGFFAETNADERKVDELYVDQLLIIEDVTDDVYAAVRSNQSNQDQAEAREAQVERLETRRTRSAKSADTTRFVQVVPLYDGSRYAAYTYKRYHDVRLVLAPEKQLGYFGGDDDNFTYPRYNLDMAFFRVYDTDGTPYETPDYFRWSVNGVQEGDAVFVIGNPGATDRYGTVAQLEFDRDTDVPNDLNALVSRAAAMRAYVEANPEADVEDLTNNLLAVENQIKAVRGQLDGLNDPYLMARRVAMEQQLQKGIDADSSLRDTYSALLDDVEAIQTSKAALIQQLGGFNFIGAPALASHVVTRAMYGYIYDFSRVRGAPQDWLDERRKNASEITDWPAELEKDLIAIRLRELRDFLGPNDPTVRRLLNGKTPEAVATALVDSTALTDSTAYLKLLDDGYLSSGDASVAFIEAIAPVFLALSQQYSDLTTREENFNTKLATATRQVFGDTITGDATGTLRIADGVVQGYAYNGTQAPPYTTYFGLYERSVTHDGAAWDLPERWQTPPSTFEKKTPLNFASTNDTTGGNSGSPVVNVALEIVGLLFDGNIESLPNNYLYTDETARAISVDARGILEALDDIYNADRLVTELTAQ